MDKGQPRPSLKLRSVEKVITRFEQITKEIRDIIVKHFVLLYHCVLSIRIQNKFHKVDFILRPSKHYLQDLEGGGHPKSDQVELNIHFNHSSICNQISCRLEKVRTFLSIVDEIYRRNPHVWTIDITTSSLVFAVCGQHRYFVLFFKWKVTVHLTPHLCFLV